MLPLIWGLLRPELMVLSSSNSSGLVNTVNRNSFLGLQVQLSGGMLAYLSMLKDLVSIPALRSKILRNSVLL